MRLRAREVDHRGPPRLQRDRRGGRPAARRRVRIEDFVSPRARTRSTRPYDVKASITSSGRRSPRGGRRRRSSPRTGAANRRSPPWCTTDRSEPLEQCSATSSASLIRTRPSVAWIRVAAARMFSSVLPREPLEAGESPVLRGQHELVDAVDPELLMDEHRLLRAEPRDRGHLADAARDLLAQRLQLRERALVDDASDLRPRSTCRRSGSRGRRRRRGPRHRRG